MAIYTTADRDIVLAAIREIAAGKRVVSIEVGGKTRSYTPTTLASLERLLMSINADLETASAITGARRVSTTVKSDTW